MDGTLINTDYANFLSYLQAIEEVTQKKLDLQFNPKKRFTREELKAAIPYLTNDQYNTIIALKTHYYVKYLPQTIVNRHMDRFIRQYCGTNTIVLVTKCREKRAIESLQQHDLYNCFNRLICWENFAESGLSNKYLNAINQLQESPLFTIVCENDIAEINHAIMAGVPKDNIKSFYEKN